ncbi:hypothetical protein SUGI_0649450 [Cryptomeria japonica]|nr:hypothetical protein SUGI_0649450 [Cryptomeria japonica]
MPLYVEILEATSIGRNIKLLQKNKSKTICSMAKKRVSRWREVADEWMKSDGKVSVATIAAVQEVHKIERQNINSRGRDRGEEEAEQPRAKSSFRDVTRTDSLPETSNPPKMVKDREVTLARKIHILSLQFPSSS